MNKPIAIVMLVILAFILILLLKALIPSFTKFLKNLPKGIFAVLFLAIIGMMCYLVWFIVSAPGGMQGNPSEIADQQDNENRNEPEEDAGPEHCIILKEDRILIGNKEVDEEYVKKYIDEHVESNTELVIADDYSTALLHHRITKICDEKGAKYRNENYEWIER